ncbi:MAG: hypothetical protein JW913_16220 [Chitinispirillaceae bacterium]|nr:hypothetical protein [Chitinispirillaceae bacterium]
MTAHPRNCYLLSTILLLLTLSVSGQMHFSYTSNTGNNMTVLIQSSIIPAINGTTLNPDDEIGVFTADGLCVGAVVWNNANTVITVWGDDERTTDVDGIKAGETLCYRFWDVSAQREVPAAAMYASGSPTYSVDGISVLDGLSAQTITSLHPPVSWQKGNGGISSVVVLDMKGKLMLRYSGTLLLSTINDLLQSGSLPLPKGNYVIAGKSKGLPIYRKTSIVK